MGATGSQGRGLVQAIMDDTSSKYTARAITRDIHSDKANDLKKIGAEVVAGDIDDPESLFQAFKGAYGAYCVTFFWEHFSPEKELEQAKAMAEAANIAGLKHIIWSTLEDTRKWVQLDDNRMPTLMGKYKVPHFDSKGEANHFFTQLRLPVTFLYTSFYWDNLISFGMGPKKVADGKLVFTLPMGDKRLPGIAAKDIGRCAYGIFKRDSNLIGKTVGIAGEHLTGLEMAAKLSRALGQEVNYKAVEPEIFRSFDIPGAEDLANMFQFKRDFEQEYCRARNPELAQSLNPSLQSFDVWLDQNKHLIPV